MNKPQKPYRFTTTWFAKAAAYWPRLFKTIAWNAAHPSVIVEIGSFEGASACWILDNLMQHPDARLYCLDTFEGGIEHTAEQRQSIEQRFRHNIALTGKAQQVETLVGRSDNGLVQLLSRGVQADFIYVDGSHQAADVLTDAVLAWKLLKPGGLLVFDDYLWPMYQNRPLLNPKIAIDAFVNCHMNQVRYIAVPQATQFCVLKAGAAAPG